MTGGRQGELLALRWRDVDWLVQKARIRRSLVRGQIGKPKLKCSSRAVPLAIRVAAALDDLHRQSAFQADDDLVFGHPHAGKPLDRSQVLKRFKRYCRLAGVREQRFHDLRHTFGTQIDARRPCVLRGRRSLAVGADGVDVALRRRAVRLLRGRRSDGVHRRSVPARRAPPSRRSG
jgi:integrase